MIKKIQEHKSLQTLPIQLQNQKEKITKDFKTIRITELLKSPLERYLKYTFLPLEFYSEELNNIKTVFGTIFHSGLENYDASKNEKKRLYLEYDGWTITGEYDYFSQGILIDYKTSSQFTYELHLKNSFKDYYWQLQFYRYLLYKVRNEIAERLINIFFILDTYNIIEVEYEPLSYDAIEMKLKELLERHTKTDKCSDEERWKRVKFIVGDEVFTDFSQAFSYSKIVKLPIKEEFIYTKCEKYCSVAKYCPLMEGG